MSAPRSARHWLRFAHRLERALHTTSPPPQVSLPVDLWQQLQQRCRHHQWLSERSGNAAHVRIQSALERTVDALQNSLEACRRTWTATECPRVSSFREIYADLRALADEFPHVSVDLTRGELTVETAPIILEEIEFGPFAIVFTLTTGPAPLSYAVIARQPYPAQADESTTHPHVRDDTLCEGQGRGAIRAALAQGRLFDCCLLVRQVLETYNPASAFVRLHDWHGTPCADCGQCERDEDLTYCHDCERELCEDCALACLVCGHDCCSNCQRTCDACDANLCADCTATCSVCGASFCERCLEDHQLSCTESTDAPDLIPEAAPVELAAASAADV